MPRSNTPALPARRTPPLPIRPSVCAAATFAFSTDFSTTSLDLRPEFVEIFHASIAALRECARDDPKHTHRNNDEYNVTRNGNVNKPSARESLALACCAPPAQNQPEHSAARAPICVLRFWTLACRLLPFPAFAACENRANAFFLRTATNNDFR